MRNFFIKALEDLSKKNKNIFLITGDVGFSVLENYRHQYPERFINAGISEQNMLNLASGLALDGYNVFVYSLANFPALRALEQFRYSVAYNNLNVKIISVGSGFSYGHAGSSHHATEDFGIIRSIPNILMVNPADNHEASAAAKLLCEYKGPAYIRLSKNDIPFIHKNEFLLKIDEPIKILEGVNTAIMASGSIVADCTSYCLKNEFSLYSLPLLSGKHNKLLNNIFEKYNKIITVEDTQLNCGFGSYILENLNTSMTSNHLSSYPQIIRKGITNKFENVAGSQKYFKKINKLYLNE